MEPMFYLTKSEIKVRIKFLSAETGHNGEPFSSGMLIILTLPLVCKVFVHLTNNKAPGGANITSALASCLEGEYLAIECGTIFEILRNEKKRQPNRLLCK